jgi:hypothetical protein
VKPEATVEGRPRLELADADREAIADILADLLIDMLREVRDAGVSTAPPARPPKAKRAQRLRLNTKPPAGRLRELPRLETRA